MVKHSNREQYTWEHKHTCIHIHTIANGIHFRWGKNLNIDSARNDCKSTLSLFQIFCKVVSVIIQERESEGEKI